MVTSSEEGNDVLDQRRKRLDSLPPEEDIDSDNPGRVLLDTYRYLLERGIPISFEEFVRLI